MKSKFKDYLLYTLSTIGVVALFISATSLPPQTSTVPDSHVREMVTANRQNTDDRVYLFNKKTGEVRKYSSKGMTNGKFKDQYYQVMRLDQ